MFIHDVTSFYNRPCFFREAKRRGCICILGNDPGKLLPQDVNVSKYFCFIDTFTSCGAYSFVLEYIHKDKTPPPAGTDGGSEQNQRFARRILTQIYDSITMALCQFPLEKGLLIMAFSDAVVRAAWQRAGGRCECGRSSCGHGPWRCGKVLNWYSRGNDYVSGGWEAHHKIAVSSGGSDTLSNCEILCISCHKNTGSYGRR